MGVKPFTENEAAKRSSRNGPARTSEAEAVLLVTNGEYRQFLLQEMLPSIIEKWPQCHKAVTVQIQQDKARPQISLYNLEFVKAASYRDIKIKWVCQPAKCPDLNVSGP